MNKSMLKDPMIDIGWEFSKDSEGVDVFIFNMNDRYLTAIPKIVDLSENTKIDFLLTVSNLEFDEIVSIIFGKKTKAVLATMYPSGFSFENPFGTKQINECLGIIKVWGETQDLEKAIEDRRQYIPSECHGAKPLWHLAALAHGGDLERLEYYRQSFEEGNHLGFVPYITIDHIKRALALAAA